MTHMSKSIPKNDAWVINEYIFALHLKLNLQPIRFILGLFNKIMNRMEVDTKMSGPS